MSTHGDVGVVVGVVPQPGVVVVVTCGHGWPSGNLEELPVPRATQGSNEAAATPAGLRFDAEVEGVSA